MIERHGTELRRAHLFLRPFFYADKTDASVAIEDMQNALQQRQLMQAAKYAGGVALCLTVSGAYEQAKKFASHFTDKQIIAIGGETLIATHSGMEKNETFGRVRKYATRLNPSRIQEISHEFQKRYEIGKKIMGETLLDTEFGIGIDKKTESPATFIMEQQFVPRPAYLGGEPIYGQAIEEVRENAEKLLIDHGLVADLYDANGNIRMHNESSAVLVDVSFASEQDKERLLVAGQSPQLALHISRIQSVFECQ